MRFLRYLIERMDAIEYRGITFVDIDETTFHTFAKIGVYKDGKLVRQLDNQEFNTYELQPGESFDFEEFRDAELFKRTSKPITPMINRLRKMITSIKGQGKGSRIIFLTARADFDNRDVFLSKFKQHGIDVGFRPNVYIERAGNMKTGTTSQRKKMIIKKYLDTGLYYKARLIDDDQRNLTDFLTLQSEYPRIEFYALKAMPNGKLKRVT